MVERLLGFGVVMVPSKEVGTEPDVGKGDERSQEDGLEPDGVESL